MHPVHCLALISALGHLCSACSAQSASPDECGPDVVYRFDKVEYEWPNRTIENRFKNAKSNPIGIKVHADRVFLNVPRWHGNDHPVNLAVVPRPRDEACIKSPSAPRLKPFPNLEFQRLGDCNAIQYVQSMQIEPSGVMWLPDMGYQKGRRQSLSSRNRACPGKLVLLDVDSGRVLHVHTFPESVVPRSATFLNDITLDTRDPDDKFAFISDSDRGVIVVYSAKLDKSWKAEHRAMKALHSKQATQVNFVSPAVSISVRNNNVNGITSDGKGNVYFSPMSSRSLFRLDAGALKSQMVASNPEELGRSITEFKDKPSQGDGLAADEDGVIYITEIANNRVTKWSPPKDKTTNAFLGNENYSVLAAHNTTMIFPDTTGFDEQGYFWVITRGWPIDDISYIVRIRVNRKSYLSVDKKW